MAHLTISLTDEVEREARGAAKAAKVSVKDFPEADELRNGYGEDALLVVNWRL